MADASIAIERNRSSRLFDLLYVPAVDKTIAFFAVLPNIIELYRRYTSADLNFPRAVLGINLSILVISMLIRRTPVRVTRKPWYWLLAFVATYGIFTFAAFSRNGVPLVAPWLTNVSAVTAAAITIYARFSLGRSIGYVPANRGIITTGAYRIVRHPIYTGTFIGLISLVLRSFSVINLILATTIVALFMIKSVVEERFLKEDPQYAAYFRRVRHRWIPGVA